jgi:hypothetical protein
MATYTYVTRDGRALSYIPTVPSGTDRALRFVGNDDDDDTDNNEIVVAAHNVQSLLAHHKDLETDVVMRRAEYLVLNETWMDAENLVQIKGFELANFKKREPGRTAGGVAIYRSVDSLTQCEPIHDLPEIETLFRAQSGTGDICLVGVNVRGRRNCVLGSIYIHPNVQLTEAQLLCFASLARYGRSILVPIPNLKVELDVPIALMCDINVDVNHRHEFADFLMREFNLQRHPNALPTTLGHTCIDHVFLRGMNECMPYVSYFSYHRPLLNKLKELM